MKMQRTCTPRRGNGHGVYHASGWESSEFGPLSVAFPHAHMERKPQPLLESPLQERANVLDARILEDFIPIPMIVFCEDVTHGLLHVREVEDHPAFRVALNRHIDLVCVAMEPPTLLVAR